MKTNTDKIIVITGCDSGMGREIADLFAAKGYNVIASYLEINPFKNKKHIFAVKCDLRKETDIKRFASLVIKTAGNGKNLYALVNNAGIAKGGPAENLPLDVYREVMEVNFFGIVSLTGKLLPLLKESKGRIIIHGSMAGKIALPFLAPYASSKFALEGYTDSLRREMKPFGVQTTLLETAGVATPIWNKAKKIPLSDFSPVYHHSLELFIKNFIELGNKGLHQLSAAQQICAIIEKKHMRPRYIIASSKFLSRFEIRIPDRLFDRILIKLFGMNYGTKK
jgi:NAD(P)-dependent dehydrogenase (short-subunit alcohol dehydrogenase family)